MNPIRTVLGLLVLAMFVTPSFAQSGGSKVKEGLDKAQKRVVDPIRLPDPPKVTPARETPKERADKLNQEERARPKPGLKTKEPPSPGKK